MIANRILAKTTTSTCAIPTIKITTQTEERLTLRVIKPGM